MRKLLLLAFTAIVVYVSVTTAAATLPDRLSDKEFWELSAALSEPAGVFLSENVLSNESGFPFLIPELQRKAGSGGVYLGVGPEQNFSYIAGLQPSMAFIIDIRRENLIEHLLYKALFELSSDRIDFVSRLFSRARPRELSSRSTARELLTAVMNSPVDAQAFQANLERVQVFLRQQGFALSPEELKTLEHLYTVFRDFGPRVDYLSTGRMPGGRMDNMPTYADLMMETDASGRERSYLSDEKSFRFVQDVQKRNLIVPVVGGLRRAKGDSCCGSVPARSPGRRYHVLRVQRRGVSISQRSAWKSQRRGCEFLQQCACLAVDRLEHVCSIDPFTKRTPRHLRMAVFGDSVNPADDQRYGCRSTERLPQPLPASIGKLGTGPVFRVAKYGARPSISKTPFRQPFPSRGAR
jgi:hypothetical protein